MDIIETWKNINLKRFQIICTVFCTLFFNSCLLKNKYFSVTDSYSDQVNQSNTQLNAETGQATSAEFQVVPTALAPISAQFSNTVTMSNQLPDIVSKNSSPDPVLMSFVQKSLRAGQVPISQQSEVTQKLAHYLGFLGLAINDKKNNLDNIRTRILQSSTQFLFCDTFENWTCLEKSPTFNPTARFRRETSANQLGLPMNAGDSLDMDYYFTQGWDGVKKSNITVAQHLADKLKNDVGQNLSMAIYGIDDIAGSLKPVYDIIQSYANDSSKNLRGVIDVNGIDPIVDNRKWILQYMQPVPANDQWLFANAQSAKDPNALHAQFQYDGSPSLLSLLNSRIKNEASSRLRIEWPIPAIMHNKFFVLEKSGHKSVWTGTANVSKECMGIERNANMAIYIRNDFIAQAFLDEFNMMFNFDPKAFVASISAGNIDPSKPISVGDFHHNKIPISHRLFTFKDGTSLRVHFAPTDDAEHRVIIPMLLSAQAGDVIRISMFGGAGYEMVRAMQYAAAKGAQIRIVFDKLLAKSETSWIRSPDANLYEANPYGTVPADAISVRLNTWPGLNHYKVGSLTRHDGMANEVVEEIIIGSQNWSFDGNDDNDENVISIQNLKTSIPAGKAFNMEFDQHLWVKSTVAK